MNLQKIEDKLEFNRFSIISILLVVQACMGGLAAGFGGMQNSLTLSILVLGTILSQALILAVSPMKYIVGFATLVTLINTIIFISILI